MGKLAMDTIILKNIIKSCIGISFLVVLAFGQKIKSPQDFDAETVKYKDVRLSQKKGLKNLEKDFAHPRIENNTIAGYTFKKTDFDKGHDISAFTRQSAKVFLERDLFNAPEYTASYYYSKYDKNSINIENIYIQLVSDSRWNRILYGSLQGTLKSYDDIQNPGEIVVNASGQVFVAERGKSRIQVLQINAKNESINLDLVYTIEKLGEITSLAYNDGGTPFDIKDDFLFVADASANTITRVDLDGNLAIKGTVYKGFKWPQAITFGRWNGVNNKELYVIDSYAKKLSLYLAEGDQLTLISQEQAGQAQSYSAVEVDHFGQVYLADGVNSELFKYTADLQLLASEKMAKNNINDINIPFGTIEINGEKHWSGFDQAFIIQKWNDQSGVQRYKLGVALNSFNVLATENNAILQTTYNLTEFANSQWQIRDAENILVWQSEKSTVTSGENSLSWERITINNAQAAPGEYSLRLEIQSVYDESLVSKEARFYLPLYYHIECGNEDNTPAFQKISGDAAVFNGQSIVESDDKIEYKVSGLSPDSEYRIAARFLNTDAQERWQEIIIDGITLDQPFDVSQADYQTDFLDIAAHTSL